MEYKSLEIKADDLGEEGTFTAYASVFGEIDRVNDIVVAGAFAKSIETGRVPKMLFNHDTNQVIGRWDEVREDDRGLFVKGTFAKTPKGQELQALVEIGAINSLSIGYRTIDYDYTITGERLLKEVDLWEVSLVTFPALESANVIASKSHDEIIEALSNRIKLLKA